ncbi:MAG: pseudouridine synthase [Gammaproteobacteria bacterium]|nr:MAG: pseudouridine synthase [Gammaproteobacteria bacterium]
MAKLIAFNKPFGVLSQFTDSDANNNSNRQTLKDYIDTPNVYAAGRLDKDSEGLLLLTDDGKLQQRIADPKFKWTKHYWAQVEGEVSDEALHALRQGVELKDGITLPAEVTRIDEPKNLWERDPPIRFRKTIPTQWLDIVIKEGRNRQVRRMTAAVNHPTLRLIRHQIGPIELGPLTLGEYKSMDIKNFKI